MRAKDLHMAATIDVESRTVMVSGGIDRNDQTIVMRIAVPESGPWTIIKAEVNLTDEAWTAWQITLGKGVSIPTHNPTNMLMSRQFKRCKYIPERGAIMFYDGEVRPGDAIFKSARLEVDDGKEIILSHSRVSRWTGKSLEDLVKHGFGDDWPKIEVVAAVRIVQPGDIDILSFQNELTVIPG